MDCIANRRSIRKYSSRPVDETMLNSILEEAMRTPTMGNLQLYSVIVTRSEEGKERLSPLHFSQPMVKNAPVVLTICADFRRTTLWCKARRADAGYDNFLSFVNATIDAMLYTQTVTTLCEAQGLGTCFLGTTAYMAGPIIEALDLPELVIPLATLTVGWPDECPQQCERLPLEAVIHNERYSDYAPCDIDRLYKAKEELEANRHFVEINGKETLAQVFTDIRYTKKDNEAISLSLIDVLKKQGFLK